MLGRYFLQVTYVNWILRHLYSEFRFVSVVQESLLFTMVLDIFLLQFVLGRGYFWSRLTGLCCKTVY